MRLKRLSLCAYWSSFAMPVSAMALGGESLQGACDRHGGVHIPSTDAAITLYVRNKHPAGIKQFPANKILLYVHGGAARRRRVSTCGLNGLSWMELRGQTRL